MQPVYSVVLHVFSYFIMCKWSCCELVALNNTYRPSAKSVFSLLNVNGVEFSKLAQKIGKGGRGS